MSTIPKKSPVPPPFADARKACRTPNEREQLATVMNAGWTPAEFQEYARTFFFKNGKDQPTALSYRRALADIVAPDFIVRKSATRWRKEFRKSGSKPMPPRREGLLIRGRGESGPVDPSEYSWYAHTEEFRSLIERRARDYFKIGADSPVHVNAWAASLRWYCRELEAHEDTEGKAANPCELEPWYAPQFSRNWQGHTQEFREQVDALALKEYGRSLRRLNSSALKALWTNTCFKYFELADAVAAQ